MLIFDKDLVYDLLKATQIGIWAVISLLASFACLILGDIEVFESTASVSTGG